MTFMPSCMPECDPSLLSLSFPEEPMFFNMDGLLPDLSSSDPFAGTTVVGSPASNTASSGNMYLEDQLNLPLKPPMLPEPILPKPTVAVDGLLNRLLAIQTRLAKILNCLSSPTNGSDDIEDIYRLSEDVISILTSAQGTQPTGVSMLLLSSCYVSLIQAFECIANALRQSLKNPDQGLGFDKFQRLSQAVMPYISVGTVRLDMPRTAITEVSLHIIGQTVQRLKASMSECAMRMNIGRNQEEWMSPVGDLTDLAMNEVRQREDNLFMHLQTAT